MGDRFGAAHACDCVAYKLSSFDAKIDASCWSCIVRTTLNIDDELLREAQRITGVAEKTALVREGLRALIERESARRLARLGGTDARVQPIPRRQSDTA